MDLEPILNDYLDRFPEEKSRLAELHKLIANTKDQTNRYNYDGHVTASGLVLSLDKTKILLINHKKLNKLIQPGGHIDPSDEDPLQATLRELYEETNLKPKIYLAVDKQAPLVPFDIDTHVYTAHPASNQPEHFHHDFRYVFLAEIKDLTPNMEELSGADWYDLDQVIQENQYLAKTTIKLKERLAKLDKLPI